MAKKLVRKALEMLRKLATVEVQDEEVRGKGSFYEDHLLLFIVLFRFCLLVMESPPFESVEAVIPCKERVVFLLVKEPTQHAGCVCMFFFCINVFF